MKYLKEVFDVNTMEQARNVVLTSDPNNPYKFEQETKHLLNSINSVVPLTENTVVLDFGCGMGRMSNALIQKFNCNIIGVDISPSMLMFANFYVSNPKKFTTVSEYNTPNTIDLVLSILVLQHAEDPKKEIDNLVSVLKPNGYLVLLNEKERYVPAGVDRNNFVIWHDDGFNVFEYLETKLTKIKTMPYVHSNIDIQFYKKNV